MQTARYTHTRQEHRQLHAHPICTPKAAVCRNTCGQALIEVCVCMIGIVVILLAMIELTSIGRIHTTAMTEARADVARVLRDETVLAPTADFLQTWAEDADRKRYTADDAPVTASAATFFSSTVEQSVSDAADWSIFDNNPNQIVDLHNAPRTTAPFFGLLKGEASASTDLLPGFQRLIYGAKTITIESEVWMTWTKGIY